MYKFILFLFLIEILPYFVFFNWIHNYILLKTKKVLQTMIRTIKLRSKNHIKLKSDWNQLPLAVMTAEDKARPFQK